MVDERENQGWNYKQAQRLHHLHKFHKGYNMRIIGLRK